MWNLCVYIHSTFLLLLFLLLIIEVVLIVIDVIYLKVITNLKTITVESLAQKKKPLKAI